MTADFSDRASVIAGLVLAWAMFFLAAGIMREILMLPKELRAVDGDILAYPVTAMLFRLGVATALSAVYGLGALFLLVVAGLFAPKFVRRWWWLVILLVMLSAGQWALQLVNGQMFGWRLPATAYFLEILLVLGAGSIAALLAGRRALT